MGGRVGAPRKTGSYMERGPMEAAYEKKNRTFDLGVHSEGERGGVFFLTGGVFYMFFFCWWVVSGGRGGGSSQKGKTLFLGGGGCAQRKRRSLRFQLLVLKVLHTKSWENRGGLLIGEKNKKNGSPSARKAETKNFAGLNNERDYLGRGGDREEN